MLSLTGDARASDGLLPEVRALMRRRMGTNVTWWTTVAMKAGMECAC